MPQSCGLLCSWNWFLCFLRHFHFLPAVARWRGERAEGDTARCNWKREESTAWAEGAQWICILSLFQCVVSFKMGINWSCLNLADWSQYSWWARGGIRHEGLWYVYSDQGEADGEVFAGARQRPLLRSHVCLCLWIKFCQRLNDKKGALTFLALLSVAGGHSFVVKTNFSNKSYSFPFVWI